jgi:hypothetical protein
MKMIVWSCVVLTVDGRIHAGNDELLSNDVDVGLLIGACICSGADVELLSYMAGVAWFAWLSAHRRPWRRQKRWSGDCASQEKIQYRRFCASSGAATKGAREMPVSKPRRSMAPTVLCILPRGN